MSHDLWRQLASRAGLALSDDQAVRLDRYIDLLLEANTTMNLTRIADREAASVLHVGDALTLLPFLPREDHRLADIGSGGGVPGIPLAIARPDASVFLIESTRKKAAFLTRAAGELGLSNVQVLGDRAEDVGRSKHRDSFDVVTARAVGALAMLVEWCLPLVKKGGRLLAMKGQRITEELPAAEAAIKRLSAAAPVVHAVEGLPGAEHHVIVDILKLGRTDARYPRPPTIAKGKPLA